MFLAEALDRLAGNRANIGDFGKALPWFEEALDLAPNDSAVRLDYADACFSRENFPKAKLLAEEGVDAEPKSARAHLLLGRTLLELKEGDAAKLQLEAAVALEPSFANGYALATAYLRLHDDTSAKKIFAEMLAGFGDRPEIHMEFGRAYATAGYPVQAVEEFKKVLAKNNKLPGAHYALGATYMVGLGELAYKDAAAEFREELKISPNDYNAHFQLGYIDLTQHNLEEAESDLTRAAELDPRNPDAFLSLGQLYEESNRPSEAETALRKSIELTKDASRNHYQVQRARYLLGRILLRTGRPDEGKKEMEISAQLLKQSVQANQGLSGGMRGREVPPTAPMKGDSKEEEPLDPDALKSVESIESQIGPAVADSYNNLGAIAASNNDFAGALGYFRKAADWNPSLEGLDYNWGRAAFEGREYGQAVPPLERYLRAHPNDTWARAALGMSLFMITKYTETLKTLRPMEADLSSNPPLAYAYGVSLVKTGEFSRGAEFLRNLEKVSPDVAGIHSALGEALAGQVDHAGAVDEFRAAAKLDPSDTSTKYHLALALIELKQILEARALLTELVQEDSRDADASYQLGKLQLESGETKEAIGNLENAARISPDSDYVHYELAAAYRQDSRTEDADREMKLYEAIRSKRSGSNEPAKPH